MDHHDWNGKWKYSTDPGRNDIDWTCRTVTGIITSINRKGIVLMEHSGKITDVKTMISCKHVSKTFENNGKKNEVLKDISLEVAENEFVVILGPGQCGKTTLVNIMAGLDHETAGSVNVNGKKVDGPAPERGVVYQKTALFPWLTVEGNVGFGPKMAGLPKKERKEKAKHYIDLVGLTGFEKSYPIKLSGGMRQRVGIARAYCNNPSVLLMDEPFGHLDAQTRYLMQEEVERIWSQDKRTVVFITNNIEEALYLADRIILLSSCPTTVRNEFKINLPRPRDYISPEFLELREEISKHVETTE